MSEDDQLIFPGLSRRAFYKHTSSSSGRKHDYVSTSQSVRSGLQKRASSRYGIDPEIPLGLISVR